MTDISRAAEEYRYHIGLAELHAKQARARFVAILRAELEAGASYAQLGRDTGLSRQRVHQLLRKKEQ